MLLSMEQQAWQKHFIATGPQGADSYADMMGNTISSLKSLFEAVDKPYSGMVPKQLEDEINSVELGQSSGDLNAIVASTVELIARNSILVQHPNCIAHLHTPPVLPAIAAEAIIAALNQSMDSWDQASAATYVEQKVVDWLCDVYGLSKGSDGVFTSGGTQSNQMGLLLARDWIADKISAHSIQKDGLPEYAHKLRIVCSENTHFTIQKSASMMGLGERAVVTVPTRADGSMDCVALRDRVEKTKGGWFDSLCGCRNRWNHRPWRYR